MNKKQLRIKEKCLKFLDCENSFKNMLNEKDRSIKHKQNLKEIFKNYLCFFEFVNINTIKGFFQDKKKSVHIRQKTLRFLKSCDFLVYKEVLQENKPKKENYIKKVDIIQYGFNRLNNPCIKKIRLQRILAERMRYNKKFIKVIGLKDNF